MSKEVAKLAEQPAPAQEPVAFCDPSDPDARTAFSWPGFDRQPHHTATLCTTPQAQRKPLDLTAAIEYADARWAGVDLAIQWCRHFADALALQPAPDPTLTDSEGRAAAAINQIERKGDWITREEAIEAIKGIK